MEKRFDTYEEYKAAVQAKSRRFTIGVIAVAAIILTLIFFYSLNN